MGIETAVIAGLGLASAIGQYNQSKNEAKQTAKYGSILAQNRADEIMSLAAKQRVSFLNAGLELEGTPSAVINDTYNTGVEDVNAITGIYNTKSENIMKSARAKLLGNIAKIGVSAFGSLGTDLSGSASSGALSSGGEVIGTTSSGLNIFDLTGTASSGGNVNFNNASYKSRKSLFSGSI